MCVVIEHAVQGVLRVCQDVFKGVFCQVYVNRWSRDSGIGVGSSVGVGVGVGSGMLTYCQ